jgi:hypothetical protein
MARYIGDDESVYNLQLLETNENESAFLETRGKKKPREQEKETTIEKRVVVKETKEKRKVLLGLALVIFFYLNKLN